jgi:hypothetical protein
MKRMVVAGLIMFMCGHSAPQQTLDKFSVKHLQQSKNPHISQYAYILSQAVWRDTQTIYVCWENPSDQSLADINLVRRAVTETWQAASKLDFTGWQQCATQNAGIRIRIDDSGPHTKGLGKQINGVPDGMVLNFTFRKWSPDCQKTHEYCVYAIAVHEFGHAVGFAHEQNRPDATLQCHSLAQGGNGDVLLTPFDPSSAMNYCNRHWNNDGKLSDLDKKAAQELYGTR